MKKSTFIVIFVGVNIIFVFLQIDKKSKIDKISRQNQRKQQELTFLLQQKESLINQLQAAKNLAEIKKYATEKLKMKKIKLSQIKLANDTGSNPS